MAKRKPMKLPDSFYALFDYLRSRGYAESSVFEYESHARWITKFMQDNGYESYTPEAYAAVMKYIDNGSRYEDLSDYQKRRYHCATVLYEFQQTGSYTFRHKKAEEAIQGGLKADIESFMEYRKSLLQAENTQKQYRLDLLRFNIFLDEKGISDVSQITTAVILQYIQERMARFTQPTIRHALTSIRQFLFYLHETGRTEVNLSLVVPNCGAPSPQKVPSIYSKEEIERLLGVMDRADPRGKRDYAMILIASRLGLRSSDICQLKFSELDWKQNRILLKQKKTGAQIELPLLSDVGEAIIDYLKYGRPQSELPYVFLKHVPPYDGVTGAAFTNAIKTGMRRAGITHEGNRKHGPHALRHSLATVLLEQNTPLPVITGILGHKNPETTKMYLAIDLTSLRKCALNVPEIDPEYYNRGVQGMVEFKSVYGSFILQYIAFKRSLGYKYTHAEFRFRVFDRFAVQEGCKQVGLTKDLFEKWMEPTANELESNRYRRVNELINFSRFLNDLGIASYCPRNIPHIKTGFTPYILTRDEVSRFFAACDENLNWDRYPTEFVYTTPALFRLLYGTGLRISEALHLETSDVHLEEGYILLRNTKNNTERMVPFSDSVGNALRQYSSYREKIFGPKTKYFFANAGDICWSKGAAYEQFRRILVRAQIPHTEKGPRLHDFRHTFSVHTLAEMSSQGLDLYYSLPILSKYLGHASLEATDHYVRLTAEMYPELLQQANQLCAYVFPEVSQDGV